MSVVVNISHVVFRVNHDFKIISCVSLYKICFVKNVPGVLIILKVSHSVQKLAVKYIDTAHVI